MGPKYAPSIRGHLPPLALFLEISLIILFGGFVYYDNTASIKIYPEFQDVNVMIFLGLGFHGAFLKRYGFSSTGTNLLIAAFGIQWAVLVEGFLFRFQKGVITINMESLIAANLSVVAALISMGAVLGMLNPVQMLIMAVIEVTAFIVSKWTIHEVLQIDNVTIAMYVHVFGAYFGLMVSWILCQSQPSATHEKKKPDRYSVVFSTIGTLFLWMFWPSFNAVLINEQAQKKIVTYNTYYALAVSTVTAFAISVITSKKGKINMAHIHIGALAGGVALGSSGSLIPYPWLAMTIGFIAGMVSILGYKYLKPVMETVFEIKDTCGVHYLHGLPGLVGSLSQIILLVTVNLENIILDSHEALNHFAGLSMAIAISLVAGLFTGLLLKWRFWKTLHYRNWYTDQAYWQFPHLATKL
ncbi:rh blood group, D antigen [Latimeria chalumnae]|uniref:rh blood group, D antigen n=1 Tax=Latimeria chalumnae TaxID=7897 RepID=UPI00313BBBE8